VIWDPPRATAPGTASIFCIHGYIGPRHFHDGAIPLYQGGLARRWVLSYVSDDTSGYQSRLHAMYIRCLLVVF
jgi:hypothetical protein